MIKLTDQEYQYLRSTNEFKQYIEKYNAIGKNTLQSLLNEDYTFPRSISKEKLKKKHSCTFKLLFVDGKAQTTQQYLNQVQKSIEYWQPKIDTLEEPEFSINCQQLYVTYLEQESEEDYKIRLKDINEYEEALKLVDFIKSKLDNLYAEMKEVKRSALQQKLKNIQQEIDNLDKS